MGNICKISSGGTRSTSVVFEDPVTARRTDALLNRWRAGEVTILQRLFRGARLVSKAGVRGLDRNGFLELFETLPKPVGYAVFSLFDSTGSGIVSFRDFCRALSWCCRGSRVERLRFLFCLFTIYEQGNSAAAATASSENHGAPAPPAADSPLGGAHASSSHSPTQAQLLHEELALGDFDDDDDDGSPRIGRVGLDALVDFCRVQQPPPTNTPMSFKQFLAWSETALADPVVEKALEPLSVLSTPSSERRAVEESWKEAKVKPGDTVFLVARPWFDQWCRYAGLVDRLANPTLPAPPMPPSLSASVENVRPDELDNSTLLRRQGGVSSEGELTTEVKPGVDFVVVPSKVWELMLRWYGGGPAFGRTALSDRKVQYRPLPLRLSVCDTRTGDVPTLKTAAKRVGRFDPRLQMAALEKQELLLRALFSSIDGHIGSNQVDDSEDEGEDEDLTNDQKLKISSIAAAVFANDYSAKDVEKEVKAVLSLVRSNSHRLSGSLEKPKLGPPQSSLQKRKKGFMSMPSSSPRNNSKKKIIGQDDEGQNGLKTAGEKILAAYASSKSANDAAKDVVRVRVWCRRGRPQEATAVAKKRTKMLTAKLNNTTTTPSQPGNGSWRLVSSKFSTLEAAGVEPWDELMFEFLDSAGNWPRAKLVEPPDFRNFKIGSRVDACDYLGKWFAGSIVAVSSKSLKQEEDANDGVVRRVCVHFDRFKSKWDEWYDKTSPSLAPPGTRVPLPVKPHHHLGDPTKNNGRNHPSTAHEDDGPSGSPKHSVGEKKNGKDPKQPKAVAEQLVPGATGLVNLGNTCFMNSALQCLSHTPLLRAYCLSEAYSTEINRTNPLGSQGRMVEEFATVLRQLWGEQFRCVAPSKFKRSLDRVKPQFAGNDQHDSQEFLAEMLDMLHEDVNRVVDKPYVVEPEDEEVDKLTSLVAGSEAWDRYLLRNRSVIVDLFQGQLKSERRCTTCDKRSLKFEPFMYLSVPLPAPTARPVKVIFVPKPAVEKKADNLASGTDGAQASATTTTTSSEANPMIASSVGLSSLFGGGGAAGSSSTESPETTNVSPLVSATAADTSATTPAKQSGGSKQSWRTYLGGGRPQSPVKYAFELPRLGTLGDLKRALEKKTGVPASDLKVADVFRHRFLKISEDAEPLARVGVDDLLIAYQVDPAASTIASASSAAPAETGSSSGNDGNDTASAVAKSSPVLDGEQPWPSSIEGLGLGHRVDAMDFQKQWFIGRIVEVDDDGCRRVSFDNYAKQWDELYGPEDFGVKLKPPFTKSKRKCRIIDIQVVHRRERLRHRPQDPEEEETSEATTNDEEEVEDRRPPRGVGVVAPGGVALELFGTPFVVRVESDSTVTRLHAKVTAHALALYTAGKKRKSTTPPFAVRIASLTSPTALRRMHPVSPKATASLPATTAATSDVDAAGAKAAAAKKQTVSIASAPDILASGSRALVNDLLLEESRLVLVLDWIVPSAYEDSIESAVADKSYVDLVEDDGDNTAGGDEDDRRAGDEDEREQASRKTQQQPAHQQQRPTQPRRRGIRSPEVVPLSSCLNAFTKEETLSDDNVWFCPKCKVNRRAVSRIESWKLPDILVIHMKRFLASSQWREKINTRVDFPLTALDMSPWVSEEARAHMPPGDTLFDLFAVINHLGVISGGHYTAFVRAVPCTRDGVEEVASSFATNDDGSTPDYRWLHVDDDIVEEVGPHQIVTDAAYVLFYRREFCFL